MSINPSKSQGKGAWFTTTSWSSLDAIRSGTPQATEALENLCRKYWYPLYAYVRRVGNDAHDAEDLTQGFFQQVLEKNLLGGADRSRGKFRSYLLIALKFYLQNARAFRTAQKRGGGRILISLDDESPEARYVKEPSTEASPEKMFEQRWAMTILEHVQRQLQEDYEGRDKGDLFDALKGFLSETADMRDYNTVAERLGMKPNAVAVAVHRLRDRYRELVRVEVAQTVASPEDVDAEMQHFFTALSATSGS